MGKISYYVLGVKKLSFAKEICKVAKNCCLRLLKQRKGQLTTKRCVSVLDFLSLVATCLVYKTPECDFVKIYIK